MYKIIFDGYEQDGVYNTYEEAKEAAWVMVNDFNAGAADLWAMNPGDYEEEMDGATANYEIIKIDE